jgi:integrase
MLTDTKIRSARPHNKLYKLYDTGGLYMEVTPTGSRRWRLKYRLHGREKGLSLGIYPHVSLSLARQRRDDAKRLLATGGDPSEKRKAEKLAQSDTFEAVAREWLALQAKPDRKNNRPALAKSTWEKALWTFETLLFPFIGSRPISKIEPPEVLRALKRIENRGNHETCHRTKQRCGQVFRYAIATGRATRDVTADLRGALAPVISQNFAAITEPNSIGELLRAIDGYRGHPVTESALKLAPLVFVRPGELRAAEWSEFDLDRAEWRVSAHRMKMREPHIVPLSKQAITILRELEPVTGGGRYVFPSLRTTSRPMSNNAITAALRRMGYGGKEMTWHGFRSLASTSLNEQGWNADWIEAQLAHGERNKVRAAYNHAQYLSDRRKMMQAWADYLDGLRNGAQVVNIRAAPAA